MAASPAKAAIRKGEAGLRTQLRDTSQPVARVFGGHIEISGADGPASRTSDGVRFVFVGPVGVAIDAERRDEPLPHGVPSMQIWTEIEVVAKLTDTPVMAVFARWRETGLPDDVELVRLDSDTHWLVAGRLKL